MVRKFLIASGLIISTLVAGHDYKVKAAAPPVINGIWVGAVMIVALFDDAYFQSSGGPGPSPSDTLNITIPNGSGGTTNEAASINLGDGKRLLEGDIVTPVTLNITLTKTGITGTLTDPEVTGTLDGVVITANKFFLLNVTLSGSPCNGQFQGTASIVPGTPPRLIFTGSGVDSDCKQQFVTGRFTKS